MNITKNSEVNINLNPFKYETAEEFNAGLLEEAEREYVRHVAMAEYSAAMAQFYKERMERLKKAEDK